MTKTYRVKGNRTAADVMANREETIETGYDLESAKMAAIELQKTGEFVAAWIEEEEAGKPAPHFNPARFAAVIACAKAKTADKRWLAAIDKAAAGVVSGWWIITELAGCVAVTTETGKTYFAGAHSCQCEAFLRGQACKHRGLYRLLALYDESDKRRPAPRITRSVERDHTGARVNVVRCDGWAI